MKELPLKLDASITAECLTFFRTAIIETTQFGQEWVSSHFTIYMDKNDTILEMKYGKQENMWVY